MDLIKACDSNDTEKALGLIMNNDINLGILDANRRTALIWACTHEMKEVALELIKTKHAKPEQVDLFGYTTLSWACENDMKEVVHELVSIGTFTINEPMFRKPEWVSDDLFV